jgi:hypothetical protein
MKTQKKYAGFVVRDFQNAKEYKFAYCKGIDSDKSERDAIAELMQSTGLSRANFIVSSLIKK